MKLLKDTLAMKLLKDTLAMKLLKDALAMKLLKDTLAMKLLKDKHKAHFVLMTQYSDNKSEVTSLQTVE